MNIYVGNLPHASTEEAVKALFEPYGQVNYVKIIKDRETGKSRGFAFVDIEDKDQANNAIAELDGKEFEGRRLRINQAHDREERRPRTSNNRFGGSNNGFRGRNNNF